VIAEELPEMAWGIVFYSNSQFSNRKANSHRGSWQSCHCVLKSSGVGLLPSW